MATKLEFDQIVTPNASYLSVFLPDGSQLAWRLSENIFRRNGYQFFFNALGIKVEVLEGQIDFELEGEVDDSGHPRRLSYLALKNGKVLVRGGEDRQGWGDRWKDSIFQVVDGCATLLEEEEFVREDDGIRVKKTLYSFIPNKEE